MLSCLVCAFVPRQHYREIPEVCTSSFPPGRREWQRERVLVVPPALNGATGVVKYLGYLCECHWFMDERCGHSTQPIPSTARRRVSSTSNGRRSIGCIRQSITRSTGLRAGFFRLNAELSGIMIRPDLVLGGAVLRCTFPGVQVVLRVLLTRVAAVQRLQRQQ